MTTQEVADRFNELSQQGNYKQIQEELYADNAVSIEPATAHGLQSVEGLEAIKQKGEMFNSMIEEMHGGYSKEPVVAGNHFSVAMGMDVTMKGAERSQMDEIAVYEVKDGKIVKEQFFF
jgi:SnoaL-like domain